MADNDITVTVNSVSDDDSRKSVKRKLEEDKFDWMSSFRVRRRYRKEKKLDTLPYRDHWSLMDQLIQKIDSSNKDRYEKERDIKYKLRTIQKKAIDYVAIWDARTVEEALNWFAAVNMGEDYRRKFVELVLKEQPGKNFSEALERVCKAWDDIRKVYKYEELFYNDTKSDKVKLEFCDWLGTETKERDVTLYKYQEMVDRLKEKLSPDFVESHALEMMLRDPSFTEHAIDYVGVWDARTAQEALNWLAVLSNRESTREFVEFVLVEQPEKSFWEALEKVCKTWDDIRQVYTYEELFIETDDYDVEKGKSDKVKLEYCDWLRTEKKTVS